MSPQDTSLGDRELDVMAVLWEIGSGTVQEVKDRLGAPLAYTTVLTIMRRIRSIENAAMLNNNANKVEPNIHAAIISRLPVCAACCRALLSCPV